MKALARMEPIAETAEQAGVAFDFPDPGDLRPPLITLERASVGYDGASRCCRVSTCASIPTTASRSWGATATARPRWRGCSRASLRRSPAG